MPQKLAANLVFLIAVELHRRRSHSLPKISSKSCHFVFGGSVPNQNTVAFSRKIWVQNKFGRLRYRTAFEMLLFCKPLFTESATATISPSPAKLGKCFGRRCFLRFVFTVTAAFLCSVADVFFGHRPNFFSNDRKK